MGKEKQEIVVIDYGMGNIGSICNMLKFLGYRANVSSERDVIQNAKKIILPGVGKFDKAISNIESLGIKEILSEKVIDQKTPILGICLGMQIMGHSSEEGTRLGLGFIDAEVKRFEFPDRTMKVPHMGWNKIEINKHHDILSGLDNSSRFYFVHSYYVDCQNPADILTYTEYGHKFVSSFQRDNIIGVQFHPEKSHKFGITLFKNFLEKN